MPSVAARSLLALAFAVVALTVLLTGQAQAAELQAKQMKVSVWPEYDDPRVLVIMQADLDDSVQLPTNVSFNIPKGADIGMACEVDSGGGHACKAYQLEDKGDYQTLTYKVEAQKKVFLEYYYDAFPAGAAERQFDFIFRPTFNISSLQLEVQEPARSSAFTLDPAFGQTSTDSEGLKYHVEDYADVAVAEDLPVKVSYSKSDNDTSVKPKEDGAASAAPAAASGAGGQQRNNALFVVLAVLGFGTLMFGGYKIFKPAMATSGRGRNVSRSVVKDRAPVSRNRGESGRGPSKGRQSGGRGTKVKFCTSCGSSLRLEDRFCPECGEEQA